MRFKLVDLSKYSFFFIGLILTAKLLAPPHTINQKQSKTWVEMTFDSMTVDERLAQLFMIEVRPTYGSKHLANVEKAIRDHQVGGVIFFKGNPTEQVRLTNRFQALSKTKMLVAIDGEWGFSYAIIKYYFVSLSTWFREYFRQ